MVFSPQGEGVFGKKKAQSHLAASQQENIAPEMRIFAAILSGFLAVPMPVRLQKPFLYPQKIRYFSYSMFSYWEAALWELRFCIAEDALAEQDRSMVQLDE